MRAISCGFWFTLALTVSACSSAPEGGEEGAACVRLAQCAPGLACVERMCTSDLTSLGEAGVVPILDAGDTDSGN
jgi:hypothetical protein